MSGAHLKVLLVEDNPGDARLTRAMLCEAGFFDRDIEHSATLADALRWVRRGAFHVVLLDMALPDARGIEMVKQLLGACPTLAVVVVTGLDDETAGLAALKAGAQDYLVKGKIDTSLLNRSVRYAVERKRMVEALRTSEERYTLALEGANDGIWDWDLETDRIFFSPRWWEMLGLPVQTEPASPSEWFDRVHPSDVEKVRSAVTAHLQGLTQHFEQECRIAHSSGTRRWVRCRGLARRDANGKPYRMAGSLSDLTDHRVHDGLTGLPNRVLLADRIERALRRAKSVPGSQFCVLVVNVDRFFLVNQGLGQHGGDALLEVVAKRWTSCLRNGDTLARLGADSFAVLQEDCHGVTDALRLTRRLQGEIEMPVRVGAHEVAVTASVGIALGRAEYETVDQPLRDAELAMRRAKERGRGGCEVFDGAAHERALALLELEAELRRALEQKELFLHYQPVVGLDGGKLCGFEALLRWKHPKRGMVSPASFIPVAEESGLILPIGQWVIEEAVHQLRRLGDLVGERVWLSVNVSPRQFRQVDLAARIREVLARDGVAPELLKVEITESAVLDNPTAAESLISELRSAGVRTAIDDFGVGFSSLTQLRTLPFDVLKIDRSFISRMCEMTKDREIVHALVTLAHSLDMSVVGEGVEEPAQRATLEQLGCDFAQGYHFARPMSAQDAENLVTTAKRW